MVNEKSGWIIESIESHYINISTFEPFIRSYYINLPAELISLKKRLINIKINDQKLFLWCHVRHINPVKTHPQRITQKDKKLVNYDGIAYAVSGKIFSKIEIKNNICINVFCYENNLTFPIYISD